MRALAVLVAIVAGIAWIMVAMILPELSQAVLASAGPNPQFGAGLRARLLQGDVLNYGLIALVATIGAALLWRAGRPGVDAAPSPHATPAATMGPLRLRTCPSCSAAVSRSDRFCGQCGASLGNPALGASDYVNPRYASESLPATSMGDLHKVRRRCPQCDGLHEFKDGTCTNCGFDSLARRDGPVMRDRG